MDGPRRGERARLRKRCYGFTDEVHRALPKLRWKYDTKRLSDALEIVLRKEGLLGASQGGVVRVVGPEASGEGRA